MPRRRRLLVPEDDVTAFIASLFENRRRREPSRGRWDRIPPDELAQLLELYLEGESRFRDA